MASQVLNGLTSTAPAGSIAISGVGGTQTTSNPVLSLTQTWNGAAVAFTGIFFNATDTSSTSSSKLIDLQVGSTSQFSVSKAGLITAGVNGVGGVHNFHGNITLDTYATPLAINQGVATTANPTGVSFVGGAHTTMTAGTETIDINWNLARTIQWATSTPATNRSFLIQAPTYACNTASQTITSGATLAISGAPVAGTNVTISNKYALWVQAGFTYLAGGCTVNASLTVTGGFTTNGSTVPVVVTQSAATSGSPTAVSITGGAHTTLTSGTESIDWNANLARTVQWTAITPTTQRAMLVQAPTYSCDTAAQTITTAATFAVTAAPTAGTNVTLTNAYAIWVQAGTTGLAASTTTAASLNLPHGSAPTSPKNGDTWTTTAGLYCRINGVTVGPMGAGGGGISGTIATNQIAYATGTNTIGGSATFTFSPTTGQLIAPTAVSSGVQTALTVTGAANTALTASTEVSDVVINLARTVQWATGGFATQRAVLFQAPTYSFVGASTITTAATVAITGAPITGTNATLSSSYALWVQAGAVNFAGALTVGGTVTLTTALSVGNGGTGLTSISSGNILYGGGGTSAIGSSTLFTYTTSGGLYVSGTAVTIGLTTLATFSAPAATSVAATFEMNDILFNLARSVQWNTGAIATQRAVLINAPTYSFVGASTITTAATVAITGAPIQGTNATISSAYALWVQSGNVNFAGSLTLGTALSVGSGGTGLTAFGTNTILFSSSTSSVNWTSVFTYNPNTGFGLGVSAQTSGVQTLATFTGAANTGMTASTEVVDINFNLARTVQWATGTLATQRAVLFQAPTYGFVAASTLTTAATVAISGAPVTGTNATITNAYALWVQGGTSAFAGNVIVGSSTGGQAQLLINSAAANNRDLDWQSAGVLRWQIRGDSTAESGSNTGTAFVINAFTDGGVLIDAPISIVRAAAGVMTFSRPTTFSSYITGTGQQLGIVTKTSAYTLVATDYTVLCDTTTAAFTVTLPSAPTTGQLYNIKLINSTNTLTISGNSKNIDSAGTSLVVNQKNTTFALQYDGTQWWIL